MESPPELVENGEEPRGLGRANAASFHSRQGVSRELHRHRPAALADLIEYQFVEIPTELMVHLEQENSLQQRTVFGRVPAQLRQPLLFEFTDAGGDDLGQFLDAFLGWVDGVTDELGIEVRALFAEGIAEGSCRNHFKELPIGWVDFGLG